jgi:hypothetical protein
MIDENTGLPELPDGQRWRIAEEYWYSTIGFPCYTGRLSIGLEESYTVPGKRRFRFLGPRTQEQRWKTVYSETIQGNHPIAARNAANRIMKRVEKDRIKKSLIGTYPPKKLEV